MSPKEKIRQDLNEALKSKEELKTSVLRLLSAAILNKEKDKRFKSGKAEDIALTDEEIIDVISSEAKKRKEAIDLYQKGGRQDLANKEKAELEILQKYLPEQLSEEELKKLAKEAVSKIGAKDIKDMGKIMAILMPQVKGRADGNLVSKIIKDLLTT
ncbi:MAG: GatB/YqeY domain-containing protein [Candidatus Nealsonbacteria bacterium]|nr:GatB/YqeY domain-containing protein [Candidatus Nealsonbacteria bacterium]